VQKTLAQLGWCKTIIAQLRGDEQYHKAVELEYKLLGGTIANFHEEFGTLLRPYMRMDHKRPMNWLSLWWSRMNWPRRVA